MTKQEILEGIKKLVGFSDPAPAPAPDPAPSAFTKYQLEDGSECEIDKMEAGGKVMINGLPAQEGVLKLSDGSEVSVDASGVILEVKQPAAPAEEDEMSKFKNEFSAHVLEFNNFKTLFTAQQQEFTEAKQTISRQDEAIKGLLQVVEQLANTPTADPVNPTPSAFVHQEPVERAFETISKNLKAIKI